MNNIEDFQLRFNRLHDPKRFVTQHAQTMLGIQLERDLLTALKEERHLHGMAIEAGVSFGEKYERLRKAIEDAREVLKDTPHEESCVTQGSNPRQESCNCFRQYPYALLKKWDET